MQKSMSSAGHAKGSEKKEVIVCKKCDWKQKKGAGQQGSYRMGDVALGC